MPDYRVALSYAGEQRPLVSQIAEILAASLGRENVFFDRFHQAALARPDLDLHLLEVYRDRSRLVVVFIGKDYERKEWCGLEMRGIRELILKKRSDQIMLIRVDEGEVSGLLGVDSWLEARGRNAGEIAELILERLRLLEGLPPRPEAPSLSTPRQVTRPGLRFLLDRWLPRLHRALTRHGILAEPPELTELEGFLRELRARIENDIRDKTYLPLQARTVPDSGLLDSRVDDPFARPIHLTVRQVLGRAEGGDSASAQIAATSRRSHLVRNLVRTLLRSRDPLVLLGDPGSGKTMTLQETALALARSEIGRVFPVVTLYIRLGEFHVEGPVGPADVLAYVKRSSPPRIRPWIDALDRDGRLVLLFDGLDEMSRDRYDEHTTALSLFAAERKDATRTLFSCRITDFSHKLNHRRLVLLPFDHRQIAQFLRRYLSAPAIEIEGETWPVSRLARRLTEDDLPIDATNPFVLWLLCLFLRRQQIWPSSRVQLLGFFNDENYARKKSDALAEGHALLPRDECYRAWSWIAWVITGRNLGAAVPIEVLEAEAGDPAEADAIRVAILAGKWCGVLVESVQEAADHLIRFKHHRFQEYFTAVWIHENRPAIDWLDKLDAPRWQETMVNLVLLGSAEEGIASLAGSIAQGIEPLPSRAPLGEGGEDIRRPRLPNEIESDVADRVELGARLVRHGAKTSPAVRDHLLPCLQKAFRSLAAYGRPITQVKMLRVCQNLPDQDLLTELEPLLRSPVAWVRDQALLLLGSERGERALGGQNLASEMAVQLASQQFLPRVPTFVRALAAARSPRLWLRFAVTGLFALLSLGLLLALAFLFLRTAQTMLAGTNPLFQPLKSPAVERWLYLLPLLAIFFGFRSSKPMWAWILGSVPVGLGLALAGLRMWQGSWDALPVVLLLALCVPVLGLVAAPLHLGTMLLYSLILPSSGGRRRSGGSLAAVASREGQYVWAVTALLPFFLLFVLLFVLALLGDLGSRLFSAVGLEALTGHPIRLVLGTGLTVWLVWSLFVKSTRRVDDKLRAEVQNAEVGIVLLGCLWGILQAVFFVIGWLYRLLSRTVPSAFSWLAVLFATAVIAGAVAFVAWKAFLLVRRTLAPSGLFSLRKLQPKEWIESIRTASPQQQQILLLRTNHQSLGLNAEEFLRILVYVESWIRKDPALSTYWQRRDELEQALRQERAG